MRWMCFARHSRAQILQFIISLMNHLLSSFTGLATTFSQGSVSHQLLQCSHNSHSIMWLPVTPGVFNVFQAKDPQTDGKMELTISTRSSLLECYLQLMRWYPIFYVKISTTTPCGSVLRDHYFSTVTPKLEGGPRGGN